LILPVFLLAKDKHSRAPGQVYPDGRENVATFFRVRLYSEVSKAFNLAFGVPNLSRFFMYVIIAGLV
jgi:hypothetical protein